MKLEACELDVLDVSVFKSGKEVVNKSGIVTVFSLVGCIVEIFDCHDDEVVADHLDVAFFIIFSNLNLNGANAACILSVDCFSDNFTVVSDIGISLSEIAVFQKCYFAEESDVEAAGNIGTCGHRDFAGSEQSRFAHFGCNIFEAVAAVVILIGQAIQIVKSEFNEIFRNVNGEVGFYGVIFAVFTRDGEFAAVCVADTCDFKFIDSDFGIVTNVVLAERSGLCGDCKVFDTAFCVNLGDEFDRALAVQKSGSNFTYEVGNSAGKSCFPNSGGAISSLFNGAVSDKQGACRAQKSVEVCNVFGQSEEVGCHCDQFVKVETEERTDCGCKVVDCKIGSESFNDGFNHAVDAETFKQTCRKGRGKEVGEICGKTLVFVTGSVEL